MWESISCIQFTYDTQVVCWCVVC